MTYTRPEERQQAKDVVAVSVVVPSFDGATTIASTLESIERALGGRRAEIIVADSSADATPNIVRERFPHVRLVRSSQRLTAGEARNRGAAAARGRLIFFTDQDCLVPPDWIDRLEAHLSDPAISGAGGSVGIQNRSSASGCALYFLEFLYHFPASRPPHRRNRGFLIGCNAAYRAEVLRRVCFPDLTLGEDVLFSQRVRDAGFSTVYDPRVAVLHRNREGWAAFFSYNRQMGRAAATYHAALRLRWALPFLRRPTLAFLAPAVILPRIAFSLARARSGSLWHFLALVPMCLLGNLFWASGFRQRAREISAAVPTRGWARDEARRATHY